MAVTDKRRGHYEMFEDEHGHRFLVLGRRWYAWIEGQQSPLLVRTGRDHRKERVLHRGRYLYANFRGDPKFRDVPHLFLEKEDDEFLELVLPNGLPDSADPQKRLVVSRKTVPRKEVAEYL